jgi:DNA polymerase-3 subunit gamma/tau
VRQLDRAGVGASPAMRAPSPPPPAGGSRLALSAEGGASAAPRLAPSPEPAVSALPQPQSFLEVVELFDRHREAMLRAHLYAHVHLVHFEPGRIEFRPGLGAPRDLSNRLGQLLTQWTGARWIVSVSGEEGEPSLHERAEAREASLRNEAARHPLVRKVLETFPGARIEAVRALEAAPVEAAEEPDEGDDFR